MSIQMIRVVCLHFSRKEKDIIEHTNAQDVSKHTSTKCHEVTLMVKLLIVDVPFTKFPHNRVSDTIGPITLSTVNGVQVAGLS
jgi:hypothetical protein